MGPRPQGKGGENQISQNPAIVKKGSPVQDRRGDPVVNSIPLRSSKAGVGVGSVSMSWGEYSSNSSRNSI